MLDKFLTGENVKITKRLLDVVSCEFKKKCLKKGGPVEAMKVQ
jgi:hypothetical protein